MQNAQPPYVAQPPTVVGVPVPAGPSSQGSVAQGVPYRVDPANASASNIASLGKVSAKRQANKIALIQRGGAIKDGYPQFPNERPWRDAFWVLPFCGVFVVGVLMCLRCVSSDILQSRSGNVDFPTIAEIVIAGSVGGCASVIAAGFFLQLAKSYPACVVWTSLVFGPIFSMTVGIVFIAIGVATSGVALIVVGFLFVLIGFLSLACVFLCWKHLIPFMIKLVEVIAGVIKENPMMIGVSFLGSVLGVSWALIMGFGFFGVYAEYEQEYENAPKGVQYAMYFLCALVFVWGCLVANNIVHVTFCGVFGRWYFCRDEGVRLRSSFAVAMTTSFGSICFGSFLIATIRALEMTVRQMRVDQQQEGNLACCVILLVLECIISCIGDMMEYFSEWAYVQVAVRGCSFIDAVRITFSMCSCANVNYIIQDLLLDSVVSMGSLLCASAGALAGGAMGYGMGSGEKAFAGVLIGLLAGIIAGGTAVGIISSGVKTILALWAEDPSDLARSHPKIHQEFHERMMAKWQ